MKKKKLWITIGIIIIIAIFVIVNLQRSKGGEIPVQVEKVQRGDITQFVSGPGKVQPEVQVKISANVSAEIMGLYVEEGDRVEKGQLLVKLDETKYVAAVERAKSNKKAAEARLIKAKNDYKRAKDLYSKKLTSKVELENAEANLKLAETDVEQAIASLQQAEDDLSKTKLYSPLDGIVTKVNKEVGEIALGALYQADVIMVVSDLARMEVLSEIDENDVVLVTEGDSVDIEIDAIPDTTFLGVVSEIAHTATTRGLGTQEEVTNFEVKISIVNPVGKLRPGMSATVDIRTESKKNVIKIPIQCVTVRDWEQVYKEDKQTEKGEDEPDTTAIQAENKEEMIEVVFIVEEGVAKISPVETGISSDTDIEVKSGLEENQKVVTGSYRVLSKTLKDGDSVKISNKSGPEDED